MHHNAFRPTVLAMAALTLCAAGAAQAQFSTDGYMRAGTGAGVKNDPAACFGLDGAGLKYRLGNECDNYVEINLKNTMKFGGLQVSGNIMPVYWSQSQEGASPTSLGQAFVEGTGFDFAPKVNFWAGKRYYGRSDVHITDTKYTQLDGTGGGADNIDLGVGKLGVSYFRRDPGFAGWGTASRLNVEFSTNNVNPGGWLRVLTGFVSSEEVADKDGNPLNGRNGTSLTIQHYQHNLFALGGGNTLWLQFARGSAALNGGFNNAFTGSGNDWIDADPTVAGSTWVEEHRAVKSWRIADAFTWQVGNFSGQAVGHYQNDDNNQFDTKSVSVGGRVAYSFTTNLKLLGEVGVSTKKPGTADTQRLSKFTIAPALSTGRGFFDRPELRLYYTHANWNDAAAEAGNGLPAGRTSANRYGLQAEVWW
jgi:maltoporin